MSCLTDGCAHHYLRHSQATGRCKERGCHCAQYRKPPARTRSGSRPLKAHAASRPSIGRNYFGAKQLPVYAQDRGSKHARTAIGIRMELARKRLLLTKEKMAAKMGVHPQTYRGWTNTERIPPLRYQQRLREIEVELKLS